MANKARYTTYALGYDIVALLKHAIKLPPGYDN